MFLKSVLKNKRGAALVEYGLLIAGVALISLGAVSQFGKKTSDLIGTVATILPGAAYLDNAPIVSGRLIEVTNTGTGDAIELNITKILANSTKTNSRLGDNMLSGGGLSGGAAAATTGIGGLIVESRQ